MGWPVTFANLAGGNQPLSLFDTMFAQVAQMVAIPCTASGINAITLSPIGSAPAPIYANFASFRFVAPNTSTGALTAQFQSNPFLNIYLADGATQAGIGSINANQEYVLVFAQALNGGAGGFFLEAASVPFLTPTAGSTAVNTFVLNNPSFPNTQLNVSYDELVMNNPTGQAIRATNQAFTINAAVNGANGLDSGSLVPNQYAVWGISNGVTAAGLLSLNYANPAMPPGYTFKRRIAAVVTDASAHILSVFIRGNRAQYQIGTNPAGIRGQLIAASGTAGTYSTTSPVLVATPMLVPPTAKSVMVLATNNYQGNTLANVLVAPTGNWGGTNNGPLGSNGQIFPIALSSAAPDNRIALIGLEVTNNMAWCSSAAGGAIATLGWEDDIS